MINLNIKPQQIINKEKILLFIIFHFSLFLYSQNGNYVKTTTFRGVNRTLPATQITYFDGLGRPIQQIHQQQSSTGKNIVTPIVYDAMGRQEKNYLPFVSNATNLLFNREVLRDQAAFYNTPIYENTANPYSQKLFEKSPLNRIMKQAAPGEAWKMGSGHEIKYDYHTNKANEVKRFKVTTNWNASNSYYDSQITVNGFYEPNRLYKTITKDENWVNGNNNSIEEFKDKEGKVILKRAYNDAQILDTYYVYDSYDNLSFVLSPKAEGKIDTNTLDNLCYQYQHDHRNRLVAKKIPGKQWEYLVYDKLDRPIITGPVLSPYGDNSQGVMVTEYDVFGRVIKTAWKQQAMNTSSRAAWQNNANNGQIPLTIAENEVLTKNYYDTYTFPDAPAVPTSLPLSTFGVTSNVKGLPTGSWVRVCTTATEMLGETSYTLYDTKYRPVRVYTKNYLGGYTQIDSRLDFSGKTLETVTTHLRASTGQLFTTKEKFTYSAQDRLLTHTHQIDEEPEQLLSSNTYDELGQLISKKVGGQDITGQNTLQKIDYTYNIRGWLKEINKVKNLIQANDPRDLFAFQINYNKPDTASPLYNGNISETLWKSDNDNVLRKYNYSYDALNRLSNASYSKPDINNLLDNYKENVSYDKNGNILTMVRNGDRDSEGLDPVQEIDHLIYSYANNSNQLMKVLDKSRSPQGFNESKDDSNGITDTNDDYSYDLNGNMTKDTNKGISNIVYNHLNLPVKIFFGEQKISYIYNALGQKVKKVAPTGWGDYAPVPDMITDYLQGGFQYKDKKLQYFPHAEGYIDYVTFSNCPTCRFRPYFKYVFHYTDHLGNIRVSYTENPETGKAKVMEENAYYPFGLKHTNYNSDRFRFKMVKEATVAIPRGKAVLEKVASKISEPKPKIIKDVILEETLAADVDKVYNYRFGNKEFQDEMGLNMYDFGARLYDPAGVRWWGIDMKAEKYSNISPYVYVANMPTIAIDPDGNEIIFIVRGDKDKGTKDQTFNYRNGNFYHTDGRRYNPGKESISKDMYKVLAAYRKIEASGDKTLKSMLKTLETSDKKHFVESGFKNEVERDPLSMSVSETSKKVKDGKPLDTRTTFDFSEESAKEFEQSAGVPKTNLTTVAHELQHQYDYDQGKMADSEDVPSSAKDPAEIRAVNTENKARKIEGLPNRTKYSGEVIDPKKLN